MNDYMIEKYCKKKNEIYLSYIEKMSKEEILPNVREFIEKSKDYGFKIALGSASKNVDLILNKLKLKKLFDVIVDGNNVTKAKPDPEVFMLGAKELEIDFNQCIVFEDSIAGIDAAHTAKMKTVGIGNQSDLENADLVIKNFEQITIKEIIERL